MGIGVTEEPGVKFKVDLSQHMNRRLKTTGQIE